MPFKKFDKNKLQLKPLSEREHDLDLGVILNLDDEIPEFDHPHLDILSDRILKAKENDSSVIMMMGAHVIRSGVSPFLIELMKKGLITHFALNGAGAIHDFELAMIGATTESVAKYISEGQFGLWKETGKINEAARQGVKADIGLGEAIGRMIEEEDFKHKDISLLAAGYRHQVPVTIHASIGCDIIHEHPNCSGSALGETSYTDFLILANSINNLEKGVFLNFGSAVTGPEVFLKCLAMARNSALQENRQIVDFTTAVFDLLDLEQENTEKVPDKSNNKYYFRPWKNILARTVADGGESFYVKGKHRKTVSNLTKNILEKYNK